MYKIKEPYKWCKEQKMKSEDIWRQIKKLPFYIVFARYMKAVVTFQYSFK